MGHLQVKDPRVLLHTARGGQGLERHSFTSAEDGTQATLIRIRQQNHSPAQQARTKGPTARGVVGP